MALFCAAITRTESRSQRLRAGPVPSPRYSGERVRVRGSSNVKITCRSSRSFPDSFSENQREFDEMVTLNGSRKRPLTLTLSPEYRGEGTPSSPLSDIVSRHSIKTGLLIWHRGKERECRSALLL